MRRFRWDRAGRTVAALRGGVQVAEQGARPGDGLAVVDLQAIQLFEREHPAAERDAPAGDAGTGSGDGDGSSRRGGLAQRRDHTRFIRGNDDALGMAAEAGRVFEIGGVHTSRITGMISGRREVSFTM